MADAQRVAVLPDGDGPESLPKEVAMVGGYYRLPIQLVRKTRGVVRNESEIVHVGLPHRLSVGRAGTNVQFVPDRVVCPVRLHLDIGLNIPSHASRLETFTLAPEERVVGLHEVYEQTLIRVPFPRTTGGLNHGLRWDRQQVLVPRLAEEIDGRVEGVKCEDCVRVGSDVDRVEVLLADEVVPDELRTVAPSRSSPM